MKTQSHTTQPSSSHHSSSSSSSHAVMKFKKAPGAPKRFKSAYMFYSEHQHKVIREQSDNKKIRAADVAKLVSQSWKELSDADRAIWLEKGRQDRIRYEREKASYTGPWKVPHHNNSNGKKDPDAPKKPMSAFLAFGNERRKAIAQANPHMNGTEISYLLSKLWNSCPSHVKKAYRDQEQRERRQYKLSVAAWEQQKESSFLEAHKDANKAVRETKHGALEQQWQSLLLNDHSNNSSNDLTRLSDEDLNDMMFAENELLAVNRPMELQRINTNNQEKEDTGRIEVPSFVNVCIQNPALCPVATLKGKSNNHMISSPPSCVNNVNNINAPAVVARDDDEGRKNPCWPFDDWLAFDNMVADVAAATSSQNQQQTLFLAPLTRPTAMMAHTSQQQYNKTSMTAYDSCDIKNYPLEELLQDDELFQDDFSPSQVPMVSTSSIPAISSMMNTTSASTTSLFGGRVQNNFGA